MSKTMKLLRPQYANIFGWLGVAFLVASTVVPIPLIFASTGLAALGITLTLFAAWRASRWWLLPPSIMLLLTAIMYFLMSKRD